MNRLYNERKTRNNKPGIVADIPEFYNKNFTWIRAYNLKYDITKALKVDFSANNNSLIEEPDGIVNRKFYPDEYKDWTDTVRQSITKFGTTTNYHHTSSLNYTLPLNKFPLTNWINSSARYTADYDWIRAPFAADTLGHTVQNSQNMQLNGTFNMLSLYNKVGYFKKVNRKFAKARRKKSKSKVSKSKAKRSGKNVLIRNCVNTWAVR